MHVEGLVFSETRGCDIAKTYLDIQLVLNNLALSHCEDDIQLPVLTPNMIIFGKVNYLMELLPEDIEEKDLWKRTKYKKGKDALWQR